MIAFPIKNHIMLLITVIWLTQIWLTISIPEDLNEGETAAEVTTEWSRIKGKIETVIHGRKIRSFLGLPYAKPPVGRLRYRPPKPLTSSRGFRRLREVYQATRFGPQCPQPAEFADQGIRISENCLYLNVWTPIDASPERLYPVLFYIHGSGFAFGSGGRLTERGDFLAALGNVVVVTPNHRLGFLGTAYGAADEMPGNEMVHDLIMALRWTHNNIARFGGDPGQVTLSGMSSGSILASMVLISPMTPYGLSNKAILMSGVAMGPFMIWDEKQELMKTKTLASKLRCVKKSQVNETSPLTRRQMLCLGRKPIQSIQKASGTKRPLPMFGDTLMPLPPDQILEITAPVRGYPMLVGLEDIEDIWTYDFTGKTKEEAYSYLVDTIKSVNSSASVQEIRWILDNYYYNSVAENDSASIKHAASLVFSDITFHCSVLLFMERLAPYNDVYFYFNRYPLARNEDKLRKIESQHADDAHLLLGQPFRFADLYNETDRQVSMGIIDMFSQFIRTGKTFWPALHKLNNGVQPTRWNIGASLDRGPDSVDVYSKRDVCMRWGRLMNLRIPDP